MTEQCYLSLINKDMLLFLHAFFKKKTICILQSPPSVRLLVTLTPHKPLDEIQPNLACELLTWMGYATALFWPSTKGPGEEPKDMSVRPSVCPPRYLLLNHWTTSNQIVCVSCSHEWGVQRHTFCLSPPPGPGEGKKMYD